MAKVNVPSSAIFPFCISNYAGSLLIFEDTASMLASNETLFFLWDKNEKEEERGMIKKKRDIDKKKERSIISNREKVLSRQQTASPLSLSLSLSLSISLSLFLTPSHHSLISLRPDCVSRPPTTESSLHQRGIAHPRKYGVRKSFKLPYGRSFAFLFKPR